MSQQAYTQEDLEALLKQVTPLDIKIAMFKSGNFDFITKSIAKNSEGKFIKGKEATHEKQNEALKILTSNKYDQFLYGGAAGGAKKQSLDSQVLTRDGFVKIRDLKVGDELINPNGKTQTVTHLHPITKDEQYVFKLSNGEEVISHEGHLWYGGWRRDKTDYMASWDNPRCIKTSKEIYEHTKKQKESSKRRLFRIPISQDVEFNQQGEITIDPYLMGSMIGNGSITDKSELKLTVFKDDVAQYIETINSLKISNRVHLQNKETCYDIVFTGKSRDLYRERFKEYGLLNHGAKDKFIPEEYKFTSRKNRLQLIRGLLDTDGHIEAKTGKTVFYTSSKKLANDFTWVCRSLGFFATTNERDRDDYYNEKEERTIKRGVSYYCYVRSKDNTDLFNIDRYKVKPNKPNKEYMSVGVLDVEIREPIEMRCITVSDPNGLYITDHFTVTHNSWTGVSWIVFMCLAYPNTKWFIARNELKDLKASVMETFKKVCREYNITDYKFNAVDMFIRFGNGSHVNLIEVKYKPSDPMYEDIGSTEYTGGWVEEIGEIHTKAVNTLSTRTGRHMNDEYGIEPMVFLTCNPKQNWAKTEFYEKHLSGLLYEENKMEDRLKRIYLDCLVTENPFIEQKYINNLRKQAHSDNSMYQRLFIGNWDYEDNPNQLCEQEMIDQVFDNDQVPQGRTYLTADVARLGQDKTCIGVWRGWRLIDIKTIDRSKTTEAQDMVNELRRKYRIPKNRCIADEDGVGGGVVDNCKILGFQNNGSPLKEKGIYGNKNDTPTYRNVQVQCLYHLSNHVNDGDIWITADIDSEVRKHIRQELAQIIRVVSDYGKIDLKRKSEIARDIGRSPDYRDMLLMRVWFDLKKRNSASLVVTYR